jgi:hypothetical protein
MHHAKFAAAVFFATAALPAFAQFGGLLQNVIGNAAKQAVQDGAQQGLQQGVTQAIVGTPAQAPQPAGPMLANGCYVNLPALPPNVQLNPDMNANGCVDQNEFTTYMQVYQNAVAQAQPVAAPAAPAGNALGSVIGGAMAVKNAGGTGNAAAWVAGQNAIGAAANAARGQPQQAAVNPTDANGDGVLTAEEIAAYQTRVAAANGVAAPAPAQVVSNATSDVVSGAVGGALKGLFGR